MGCTKPQSLNPSAQTSQSCGVWPCCLKLCQVKGHCDTRLSIEKADWHTLEVLKPSHPLSHKDSSVQVSLYKVFTDTLKTQPPPEIFPQPLHRWRLPLPLGILCLDLQSNQSSAVEGKQNGNGERIQPSGCTQLSHSTICLRSSHCWHPRWPRGE